MARPLHRVRTLIALTALTACHARPNASVPDATATTRAPHDAATADALAPAPDAASTPPDASPADAAIDPNRPRRVTLTATGDLVLAPRVTQFAQEHRDHGALLWVLARVAPLVTEHEVFIADLATPLSTHYRVPGSGPFVALGAPPEYARSLARVGLDAVSLATIHAYDQTADGLAETLDALHAANVATVGAGTSDDVAYGPIVIEREGVRVAVLGFCERTNDGPGSNHHEVRVARLNEPARALAAVTAARAQADLVVVAVQWSRDYVAAISTGQRALARQFVEAGADFIVGSGPGLLQRVERVPSPRGEAVVAYSLGHLVSNQGVGYREGRPLHVPGVQPSSLDPATRDGVLLRATFELPREGEPRVTVASLAANALWIENDSEQVRPVPLRHVDEPLRTARLRTITAALGPAVRVRP